ncbi:MULTISPECIES: response regulator [unclassified Thioalkalivibrio]|uniref:response regulator n=1 Tax=unclassified Thioalkalivibrio TaxID=2621013 RepID=UPI000369ACD4|nr:MULTISPECIES: response regulator [unclassified Thioalkalivibrio]
MDDLKKVLLVDDDADIHEELREALEAGGYQVWHEANGEGARSVLGKHAGIRIVLLDLRLPGEDGMAILESIRRDFGDAHAVIMVTGHGSKDTAITALRQGVTDFLEKPVDPDSLFSALERAERLLMEKDLQVHSADGCDG